MNVDASAATPSSALVDHIRVMWFEPQARRAGTQLLIWLPHLSGTKAYVIPYLQDLAAAGFVALSFDPWQHGARGHEAPMELATRVFGNFRRHMWPILGQTTLDTLRVIDWAVATLDVDEQVCMGGLSMGGDIAVAAAGIDHRIERVAAVIATPDWLRPGMHDVFTPDRVLPQGEADAYAQYFYDQFNPLTHVAAYSHAPAMRFDCGAVDTHVPPDGAQRFQAALREVAPAAAENIHINLRPGLGHLDFQHRELWWHECLAWLRQR